MTPGGTVVTLEQAGFTVNLSYIGLLPVLGAAAGNQGTGCSSDRARRGTMESG